MLGVLNKVATNSLHSRTMLSERRLPNPTRRAASKDLTSTSSGVQRNCIHHLVPTLRDNFAPWTTFSPKS